MGASLTVDNFNAIMLSLQSVEPLRPTTIVISGYAKCVYDAYMQAEAEQWDRRKLKKVLRKLKPQNKFAPISFEMALALR